MQQAAGGDGRRQSPGTEQGAQSGKSEGQGQNVDPKERVKQAKDEVVHGVRDKAETFLRDKKDFLGDQIRRLAGAVHATGEELGRRDQPTFARYAEEAAVRIDRFSDTIRSSEVSDMVDNVRSFAREKPAVFLGVTFLGGLMLSRVIGGAGSAARRELGGRSGSRAEGMSGVQSGYSEGRQPSGPGL